jgi:DNA-binding CsgD family transcriptional regulator
VQRLRAEDLRAVVEFGHEAGELTQFSQLGAAIGRLAGLVGADTATLTHLDLQTGHEVVLFWPSERAGRARLEAYAEVGHTHPLRPLLAREIPRRAAQRLVPRTSDVLSARQWRSHPVRSAMPDIADQMAVLLGGRRRVLHAVTLGRLAGPFGDRQRDSFAAAGPLLSAPLARAARHGHRALQIAPHPLWVPATLAPALDRATDLDRSTTRHGRTAHLPISPRELEVLRLVAEGATDAQVARRLGLQPATVSKHLSRIYARLGVPNRAAAVRYLIDHSI